MCWKLWLETCETNKAKATCPGCRQELQNDVVENVLGRAWETVSSPPIAPDIMDEFTETWMQNHQVMQCQNCGARIKKTEGCSAIMCLCGYRFCWCCELPPGDCGCGNCDDIGDFYDNTLQAHLGELANELVDDIDDEDGPALKVASAEEFMELRKFLEWRRENLKQRKE